MAKKKKTTVAAVPPAAAKWVNRIVGHAQVAASTIMANPLNFRIHPSTQRAAVSEAISRVGWIQEVIINRTTGRMLDGHLRVDLASARNEIVPVTYVELTEAEERLVLASFDPLGGLAVEDPEKLGDLIAQIELGNSTLDMMLATAAQDAAISRLLDDVPDDERMSDGPRLSNLGQNIAIVIGIQEGLGIFEKAIRATDQMNRGEAIIEICRSYLHAKGQFDV